MGGTGLMLAKGTLLGLSIAAPIGPMALLCFRATLTRGFRFGVLAGLGVAAGDVFYAAVAAFGLTAVASLLTGQSSLLALLGGAYLVWFGLGTALRPPPLHAPAARTAGAGAGTFARTFLLTLANPPTIMIFTAMFAGLGLGEARDSTAAALAVVTGVLLGSAGWWVLFAGLVSRIRDRIAAGTFLWINRVSGTALALFGAWALIGALGRGS